MTPKSIVMIPGFYYTLNWNIFPNEIIVGLSVSCPSHTHDYVDLTTDVPSIALGNNMNDLWLVDLNMTNEEWKHCQKCFNLSQAEIDEIIKELNSSLSKSSPNIPKASPLDTLVYKPGKNGFFTIDPSQWNEPDSLKTCDHVYVDYLGLNESFKYCKKCDHKIK